MRSIYPILKSDSLRYFLVPLFALFLLNCQGLSTSSSSSTSSTSSTEDDSSSSSEEVVADNIETLTVSGTSGEIALNDISDDEDVIVVLYSYSGTTSSGGFQVGSSASTSFLQAQLDSSNDDDVTEDFHSTLRQFEEQINEEGDEALLNPSSKFLMAAVSVGSEKTFKVLDSITSSTSYTSVTATLRYSNNDVELWVDNRNAASLTDDQLEDMADQFLVSQMRNLFGDESDVNGDGKFAVLYSQAVNELGAMSGGIITGYFYAMDLFSETIFSQSNEMEVFYTVVPDPDGDFGTALPESYLTDNVYTTVLHHEFQHMISYNQHYFLNDGASEEAWMNEGLSHLAEDMMTINSAGFMAETSIENPSRVSGYLADIQDICFSCGSNIYQRGGSYLFLRYLYEQAQLGNISNLSDGAAFIEAVMNTDETGTDNLITALFGASGDDADLKTMVGRFALTVYLSNTGAISDNKYNFTGIDLRASQNDNRGTVLDGPDLQSLAGLPFTDTLQGISLSYLQVSGETINDNGGVISFTFDDDLDFGGYVIR